jgi:hypothetical protein
MKLTTIFSSAIAAVGLAACGSTAAAPPTARPTLSLAAAPTVAPTATATPAPTATPIPTPSPSDQPSPSASASPSPSESPCVVTDEQPCETPPVVTVTACAEYQTASGGEIAWTGADSKDTLFIDASGISQITLYPIAASGSYGPLEGDPTRTSSLITPTNCSAGHSRSPRAPCPPPNRHVPPTPELVARCMNP